MIQPVRIQRSRQHKQISPNGLPIAYVGRPGRWGNPFKVIKEDGVWWIIDKDGNYWDKCHYEKPPAVKRCVELYYAHIEGRVLIKAIHLEELRGKNLGCWCKIGDPCHADVLLELANKI